MSAKSIIKNTAHMYLGEILSNAAQLAFIIILTRYLGAEGFGKLSFAISAGWLIVMFVDIGINNILFREMSSNHKKIPYHASRAFTIKSIIGLSILILAAALMTILRFSPERIAVVLIVCSAFVIDSVGQIFRNAIISMKRMKYESLTKIIFGFSKLIILAALIYLKTGLTTTATVYLTSSTITAIVALFMFYRKIGRIKPTLDLDYSKWLLSESYPLLFGAVSMKILFGADILMLTWMRGDLITGLYSAPSRLIMNGFFFAEVLIASSLPYFVTYMKTNKKNFVRLGQVITTAYMIIFIPIITIFITFHLQITTIIFGNEFAAGSHILAIFSVVLMLYYFSAFYHTLYLLARRVKRLGLILTASAALNIILNYLLISVYSITGAAAATIISFTATAVAEYAFLSRTKAHIKIHRQVITTTVIIIILVLIIKLTRQANPAISIAAMLIAYAVLVPLSRLLRKNDVALLLCSLKLKKLARLLRVK